MKRIILIFCFIILFSACSHTVVGGQEYSPNGEYVFIFESHGASGKAYNETSEKRVYYSVKEKDSDNLLLKNDFEINAGDLSAEITWDSNEKLEVIFYESNGNDRKK